MKFIHLSDINIGSTTESGTRWDRERRDEIESGLGNVMSRCREIGAKLVIIAGGLFSHMPVTAELDRLCGVLDDYPDVHVVIIAGESDRIRPSSPVLSYGFPANVHYVLSGKPQRIVIDELDTEVFAASYSDTEKCRPGDFAAAASNAVTPAAAEADAAGAGAEDVNVADIKTVGADTADSGVTGASTGGTADRKKVRIAVMRSDDTEAVKAALSNAGFTYVAVGSSAASRKIIGNTCCCGRFEPEEMGDSGQHGMLEGEISDRTGTLMRVEFNPMAAAAYVPLLIKTNIKTNSEELERLIAREIERRGAKNIYRLKLSGTRNPDETFDLGKIRDRYRVSEVIDETEPEYDYSELFAEHPQDMIGFYITRIVNSGREMSEVEKRAMFYGLDALLKTTDSERQF